MGTSRPRTWWPAVLLHEPCCSASQPFTFSTPATDSARWLLSAERALFLPLPTLIPLLQRTTRKSSSRAFLQQLSRFPKTATKEVHPPCLSIFNTRMPLQPQLTSQLFGFLLLMVSLLPIMDSTSHSPTKLPLLANCNGKRTWLSMTSISAFLLFYFLFF